MEYNVPNGALKCKEGMDKIEAEMRPDFRRKVLLKIRHASLTSGIAYCGRYLVAMLLDSMAQVAANP